MSEQSELSERALKGVSTVSSVSKAESWLCDVAGLDDTP
jgi:hypothetical protein